ncbi:MAG TPA: type VI secretion system contractile sheath large subunit, partial [Nannocystis sp.]
MTRPSRPARARVDAQIHELDRKLATILGSILHHPKVQRLESLWRGLHRLVTHTRPHENIAIDLLIVDKQSLHDDFLRADDLTHSGLHHHVYTRAYASHGGRPYGLLCATFDFGPGADDLDLLRSCATVASLAHAPFVADAAPSLLGLRSLAEVPRLRDLAAAQTGPRFTAWHAFRASPEARHVALCLPRFLLRAPHDSDTAPTRLPFREHIDRHEDLLWGNASLLVAMRTAESFAEQRWCLGLV